MPDRPTPLYVRLAADSTARLDEAVATSGMSKRQIVEDALCARPQGSPFVFATSSKAPISGWSKAKTRLDRETESLSELGPIPHWTLHDFRRAFATTASDEFDTPIEVVDRALNHVGAATASTVARVYARSELYAQRQALACRWADFLSDKVKAGSWQGGAVLINLEARRMALAAGESTYQGFIQRPAAGRRGERDGLTPRPPRAFGIERSC